MRTRRWIDEKLEPQMNADVGRTGSLPIPSRILSAFICGSITYLLDNLISPGALVTGQNGP
jgi:hypothetical protein